MGGLLYFHYPKKKFLGFGQQAGLSHKRVLRSFIRE